MSCEQQVWSRRKSRANQPRYLGTHGGIHHVESRERDKYHCKVLKMLKKKKVVFMQPCPEVVVEDQERDQGRWTLLRNVNQVLKPTTMLAVRRGVPSPEHGWKLSGCFEICLAVDGILVLLTPASLTFLLFPPTKHCSSPAVQPPCSSHLEAPPKDLLCELCGSVCGVSSSCTIVWLSLPSVCGVLRVWPRAIWKIFLVWKGTKTHWLH